MKILGIETSCDETAAAVVGADKTIHSNIVASQIEAHAPYGGVVPEIASRAHVEKVDAVIAQALEEADTTLEEIEAVAVTAGPGLIGGVIVGLMAAKGLAAAAGKPLVGVNHLEGHALTVRLTDEVEFPYLMLLVSGGHCQILAVEGVGKYHKLGATIDDALGEAFDKTAKMLGLGYPGGPAVEKMALEGNEEAYDLPRPLLGREGCDFSFAGLKTAIYYLTDELKKTHGKLSEQMVKDICASFQRAAGDIITDRLEHAILAFAQKYGTGHSLVVAGGVAANQYLNGIMRDISTRADMCFIAPPIRLCTDNAAMIAWAGIERYQMNLTDRLDITPRARWPLESLA